MKKTLWNLQNYTRTELMDQIDQLSETRKMELAQIVIYSLEELHSCYRITKTLEDQEIKLWDRKK